MKRRFILYRRKRGGTFYIEDTVTRKQESLGTKDRAEATALLNARHESVRQPQLNLQIAKAYLAGSDSGVSTRTWQNALDAIVETKTGSTQDRWRRAAKEKALDLIRDRVIIETQAEQLLACLKAGTVSTNIHLRKLHNFCLSMNWLPWPIIPKRLWPEIKFRPRRAITAEEHLLIIEREKNPERRNFYELCWHLGGSQTDIANLKAEDIVGSHVGVADEAETQFEAERLIENFLLKDSGANHLAVHRDEHLVFARGEDVNLRDLRFLVKLLGAELDRLARPMVLRLLQRRLQEHLPQQFRVVEILGVALKERDGRKVS